MALLGAKYLIAVMTVFPLLFVVLVLFLFGEMTQNVITKTELLPLPSATFMADEGPSHGRGGSFPWPTGVPSLDRALGPAQILTWAFWFYTPTVTIYCNEKFLLSIVAIKFVAIDYCQKKICCNRVLLQ